ncbi:unnamed protein product, partial [Scytosiphon promiscuus]
SRSEDDDKPASSAGADYLVAPHDAGHGTPTRRPGLRPSPVPRCAGYPDGAVRVLQDDDGSSLHRIRQPYSARLRPHSCGRRSRLECDGDGEPLPTPA